VSPEELARLDQILDEVRIEVRRATLKHGAMNSAHEGYAVLQEEVDELWDDVKHDNLPGALDEALQVAAMGVRFIYDLDKRSV